MTSDRPSISESSLSAEQFPAEASAPKPGARLPRVFDFTDYREYLKAFYEAKKSQNPLYTMSSFARRAGLGANSRGYLKLVIDGKRNLSPTTVRRFIEALSLGSREALYFENLVYFNQSKTTKDREYFLGRLGAAAAQKETRQLELIQAQFRYWSSWYLVAVRELASLKDFRDDPAWIAAQLRNKISRRQAQDAVQALLQLGLLQREQSTGRLTQSVPLVKHAGSFFNDLILKFHLQMLDRAREAIQEDPFEERGFSCVTLSCPRSMIPRIRQAIADFRDHVMAQFAESDEADAVVQLNFQLFQLTPVPGKTTQRSHS